MRDHLNVTVDASWLALPAAEGEPDFRSPASHEDWLRASLEVAILAELGRADKPLRYDGAGLARIEDAATACWDELPSIIKDQIAVQSVALLYGVRGWRMTPDGKAMNWRRYKRLTRPGKRVVA